MEKFNLKEVALPINSNIKTRPLYKGIHVDVLTMDKDVERFLQELEENSLFIDFHCDGKDRTYVTIPHYRVEVLILDKNYSEN